MEIRRCDRVEGIHFKLIPGQARYAVGYTDQEDFYSMPDWLEQGGYQGAEIRFLDLKDDRVYVPYPKTRNVLFGNALAEEDALWFLKGDFHENVLSLIRYRPGTQPEAVHTMSLSEVNLYNLQILGSPVHIVSQGAALQSYYPEPFRIPLEPNEKAVHLEGDRIWCSAWVEEGAENGSLTDSYRYYETTVVKDRKGNTIARETGDLELFPDGIWRIS